MIPMIATRKPKRATPQAKIAQEDPIVRSAESTRVLMLVKSWLKVGTGEDQIGVDFTSYQDIVLFFHSSSISSWYVRYQSSGALVDRLGKKSVHGRA